MTLAKFFFINSFSGLVFLIAAPLNTLAQTAAIPLPEIGVQGQNITVSGLSSGAHFALQMAVAHSSQVKGVASFAGGIFACAKGDSQRAQNICMKTPEQISVAEQRRLTDSLFEEGKIDNPANLINTRAFIFHGSLDEVVHPQSSTKLIEYLQSYGSTVTASLEVPAGHGFPALHGRVPCEKARLPYLNDCDLDGAHLIFNALYPSVNERRPAQESRLYRFDQGPYSRWGDSMASTGHLYLPRICETKSCRLHIAFHGCLQSPLFVQNAFVSGAGYNDWAEANEIVILYPSVRGGATNPYTCWDWFGYTDASYLTREGVQLQAIMKMVAQLAK